MRIMLKISSICLLILIINSTVNCFYIRGGNLIVTANDDKISRPTDHAKIARHLVHKSIWASAGTISTDTNMKGFPMVNIIAIADSENDAPSTGNIYFLLTILDFTAQDLREQNMLTFMISDDQDLSCQNRNNTDPMEPTCARAIISGKVIEMNENDEDYQFGMSCMLSRHPAAKKWQETHKFFLCKLDITNIYVLDWYGGPHYVTTDEYYNVKPENGVWRNVKGTFGKGTASNFDGVNSTLERN